MKTKNIILISAGMLTLCLTSSAFTVWLLRSSHNTAEVIEADPTSIEKPGLSALTETLSKDPRVNLEVTGKTISQQEYEKREKNLLIQQKKQRECMVLTDKYCSGLKQGAGYGGCIAEHATQIGKDCVDVTKNVQAELDVCRADIAHFCDSIPVGQGRIVKCLIGRRQSLNLKCRSWAEEKAEKMGLSL